MRRARSRNFSINYIISSDRELVSDLPYDASLLCVRSNRLDFQRDVRILAALEDRNIARVLGACYREEPYCVVMEYLEHGDLCQFLKTHITAEDAHSMPIGVKTLR